MSSPRSLRLGFVAAMLVLAAAAGVVCEPSGPRIAADGGLTGGPPVSDGGVDPSEPDGGGPLEPADGGEPPLPCDHEPQANLSNAENAAREALACESIRLEGRVISSGGEAVAGARVTALGREATTGSDGAFSLQLWRRNAMVQITAAGHRPLAVAVELRVPVAQKTLPLGAVELRQEDPETVRMLFSGDFSLGRRFLDSDESEPRNVLPPDDPTALVRVSDPAPGSRATVQWVKPYFDAAEFRVVNLESPVTDRPTTPHQTKDYAFFTLPGSLEALKSLGVQYVSLGNNHTYDYLEQGLVDTLDHVAAHGFGFSGAGRAPAEAFKPWSTTLGGRPYSFVSATSIAGDEHPVNYVANAGKGGAADLRDDARVSATLRGEVAEGRMPIALLHMGFEYAEGPQEYSLGRIRHVIGSGAGLVIAHHPHVVQGFGWHDGVLAAHSLGNFVFDQDRLETMLGALLQVELRGTQVEAATLIPTYLEDYRPRPVVGDLADLVTRRVAAASHRYETKVSTVGGRAQVLRPERQRAVSAREVKVAVEVTAQGWAVVDLRALRHRGESLAKASIPSGALRPGSDALYHGDFEDHDVDDREGELERWDLPAESSFPCLENPHGGVTALCLTREASSRSAAFVSLRNRVRVPGDALNRPNKDLTLLAWARGENAGPSALSVTYYASEGDAEFGSARPLTASGTFGWKLLAADLRMPADPAQPDPFNSARALRIFLSQEKPESGRGVFSLDDLAVVAWDKNERGASLDLRSPNTHDFLRVEAPAGTYEVTVTFERDDAPLR